MARIWTRIQALTAGLLVAGLAAGAPGDRTATTAPLFTETGLAAIRDLMRAAVRDGRTPAATVLLARDGEILWLETAGEMNPGMPMGDDAIVPLASIGKLYTAAAAMILVERGRIALDDPVSKYIPEFAKVSPGHPITVFHLLTHTSGLTVDGDAFWAAWDANTEKTNTTAMARALAGLPLVSQPGEVFEYGPTGAAYEVLAAVIEIASGQTLEDFMAGDIFRPLGLHDTCFYLPPEKAKRRPAIYRRVDGALRVARAYGEPNVRSSYFYGGGGVQSSPRDVLRFARLFLHGGEVDGVRILKPGTVRQMMSDQLGKLAPESFTWGFGGAIQKAPSGGTMLYGWTGGGFSLLWVDPALNLVAYFTMPLTPPGDNDLLADFRRLVYQARAVPWSAPGLPEAPAGSGGRNTEESGGFRSPFAEIIWYSV
jgi:CubicO group peptidase (beta-lactamase class C family)